jgi:hypothetical protein
VTLKTRALSPVVEPLSITRLHSTDADLKNRILNSHRVAAIEAILQQLDGEGMPAEAMPMVRIHARRTAKEWRDAAGAACEIEARLHRSGFDDTDINAEVFVQVRELFAMFDQLMRSAQSLRLGLMREISVHREFAIRVRRVIRAAKGFGSSSAKPSDCGESNRWTGFPMGIHEWIERLMRSRGG